MICTIVSVKRSSLFFVALILFSALGLQCGENEKNPDQNPNQFWSNVGSTMLVAIAIRALEPALYQCVNAADYVYKYYWLTPDELAKALKQEQEVKEYQKNHAIMISMQAQLTKDPRWKEIIIKEKEVANKMSLQNIELAAQSLWDNKIGLEEAARKEEQEKIKHIEEMLKKVDGHERENLEKSFKGYVASCMRKNMEVNVQKI